MSSIANPQPDLPAADELVAYLDGELAPEECRRVEERLANDAEYRQQLRDLDLAWEALNALPSARADDDFARTTMELVTVAAKGELSQQSASAAAAARRRAWQWAAAGVIAAIVGFAATWGLISRGDRELLAELPVVRQADLLRNIEDLEFLRQLSTKVPAHDFGHDEAAVDEELAQLAMISVESPRRRREWVESLSAEQRATLAAQAKRFRDLPEVERERLRQLHLEISGASDREELQRYLIAYDHWLARLRPGKQEDLKDEQLRLPVEEQVELVAEAISRDREQASRRLSSEDAVQLRQEVLEIAQERRPAFERELRRRDEGRSGFADASPGRVALAVLAWELRNDATRERLMAALSEDARERLERLGQGGRRWQLWQWIRDALRPEWGPGELERFFTHELSSMQREQLLELPLGEMQSRLEQMYVSSQFGLGDGAPWWLQESRGPAREGRGDGRGEFRLEMRERERPNPPRPPGAPRRPRPGDAELRPGPPPPDSPRREAI